MRIVTFGGTLVDVEVWSHPVVWGTRLANQVHLRPVDSPLAEIARLGVELAGPRTEAVVVTDLETRIVAWNAHATELFGWTAEEAVGRLVQDVMGGFDEADAENVARGLEDGDGWSGVQSAPTKNGPDTDVHLSTRYVRDWRGSVLGVVLVCHGVFGAPEDDDALMDDLAVAIDDDQLVVHYQPIVRAEDGVVVKVEALVRWQHPELGLLSPAQFIPGRRGPRSCPTSAVWSSPWRRARWPSGGTACCPASSWR
jgi:PAS domain S-box-containing protein